jgi:Golgi nucleoside diphosphatase
MRVKPGLSSFAENPSEAGASLLAILDFATSRVPENK